MKILLDTNVILDLLLEREKFAENAKEIVSLIEEKYVDGYLCATTITTIFYLISKYLSKQKSIDAIKTLLEIFDIADVSKNVLLASLQNSGNDYEDSVIYTSAAYADIDYIITRDIKGFKNSKIEAVTPIEFLRFQHPKRL